MSPKPPTLSQDRRGVARESKPREAKPEKAPGPP